jgi:hypothetical protein
MPYPIAHPAAVIPLYRLMGRFAVPSALVIGSIVPDLWYFAPGLARADSHSAGGLLWFCLPVGLVLYMAFHLLLKQPLIALLPADTAARAGHFATASLPPAPWLAVLASLLAGALTHAVWDLLTHPSSTSMWLLPALDETILQLGRYELTGYGLLQHASTLTGTAIVLLWARHKLRAVPGSASTPPPALPAGWRVGIVAGLIGIPIIVVFGAGLDSLAGGFDLLALRKFARTAGIAALAAFALGLLAYCALWHAWRQRESPG